MRFVNAIRGYDEETLDLIPEELIPNTHSPRDFIGALNVLLETAINDSYMFLKVLNIFEESNLYTDFSIINQLALDPRVQLPILFNIRYLLPDISVIELLSQWEDQPIVDATEYAISRLMRVYGIPEFKVLKELMADFEKKGRYELQRIISRFAATVSEFAPIPDHVQGEVTISQYNEQLEQIVKGFSGTTIPEVDIETLAKKITAQMEPYVEIANEDGSNLYQEILYGLTQANATELNQIAKTTAIVDYTQRDDTSLIKYFGPSNPLVFLTEDNQGQDRMLLCDLFDHEPETGDDIPWFEGHCDQCSLRIKDIQHAVRLPRASGGWEGCFCSWKCAKDYAELAYKNDESYAYILDLVELFSHQLISHPIANVIGEEE